MRLTQADERAEFYKMIGRAMGFEFHSEKASQKPGDFSSAAVSVGMAPEMVKVDGLEIERRKQDDPNWSVEHDCWIWNAPN